MRTALVKIRLRRAAMLLRVMAQPVMSTIIITLKSLMKWWEAKIVARKSMGKMCGHLIIKA